MQRMFLLRRRIPKSIFFSDSKKIIMAKKLSSVPAEQKSLANSVSDVMNITRIKTSADNAKRLVKDETTSSFMNLYEHAVIEDRIKTLIFLSEEYGVNHDSIIEKCDHLIKNKDREIVTIQQMQMRLLHSLQPPYVELFLLIARINNGMQFLLKMRQDAMESRRILPANQHQKLNDFQEHLRHLLSLWFSVGLLTLNRVTWNSPATLLEKIGKYEAVHQVRNWVDLKQRLGNLRRCYTFHHSTMPLEPLIVLHVALTKSISNKITDIIKIEKEQNKNEECLQNVTTAIFYSITSTQHGLQGIELGLYLIQAVVKTLQQDIPHLTQFSSLSPIPGYRTWLLAELGKLKPPILSNFSSTEIEVLKSAYHAKDDDELLLAMKESLVGNTWIQNKSIKTALQAPLQKLCAIYLYSAKKRGYALDPVCNFHLRNGAVIWRMNWFADPSAKGIKQSFGLMVNYRYYLDDINENSKHYIIDKNIVASDQIHKLLSLHSNL